MVRRASWCYLSSFRISCFKAHMSLTSDDRKLSRFSEEEEEKLSTGVLNSQCPKWGILWETTTLNVKQNFLWIKQVGWVFWFGLLQNYLTLLTASVKIMLSLVIPVALLLVRPNVEIPFSLTRSWFFYLVFNIPSSHRTLEDSITNEDWLFQHRKQNRKQLFTCTVPLAGWQVKRNKELQLCSILLIVQKHGCMVGYTGKGYITTNSQEDDPAQDSFHFIYF